MLADLQTIDARLARLEREARMKPDKRAELAAVQAARAVLDEGRPISSDPTLDREALRESFLLTDKPFIYVFNLDDTDLGDDGLRGASSRIWSRLRRRCSSARSSSRS